MESAPKRWTAAVPRPDLEGILWRPLKTSEIIDRIAALPVFATATCDEIEWLASRGNIRSIRAGTTIFESGSVVSEMYVLLTGHAGIYSVATGGERRLLDLRTGHVLGAMPYSRLSETPASVVAEDDVQALVISRAQFTDLVRECPNVTESLMHYMIDRVRLFHGARLNDDRLQSLGRLASGLAHELNNPASAATRHALSLPELLERGENAARAIAAAHLSNSQLEAVDAIRGGCAGAARTYSTCEIADREDDIADWLERHNIDAQLAETLASCDVDAAALDQLAKALPAPSLGPALTWVASGAAMRALARELGSATGRIHDLVAAVKGFSFMDREDVPGDVSISRGLADTIAVLQNKARAKSVTLQLHAADDLPRVHGFGSEINQVWENLIDNAIDASPNQGKVEITAIAGGDSVVVRVIDDGMGIPADHRVRIFDPFFTTKDVGQGTGLGLDLARRVVHAHRGDIDFTSQPGKTVFRVRLPAVAQGVRQSISQGRP